MSIKVQFIRLGTQKTYVVIALGASDWEKHGQTSEDQSKVILAWLVFQSDKHIEVISVCLTKRNIVQYVYGESGPT